MIYLILFRKVCWYHRVKLCTIELAPAYMIPPILTRRPMISGEIFNAAHEQRYHAGVKSIGRGTQEARFHTGHGALSHNSMRMGGFVNERAPSRKFRADFPPPPDLTRPIGSHRASHSLAELIHAFTGTFRQYHFHRLYGQHIISGLCTPCTMLWCRKSMRTRKRSWSHLYVVVSAPGNSTGLAPRSVWSPVTIFDLDPGPAFGDPGS